MKTWQEAFKPPFRNWHDIALKDSQGRMVANFLTTSKETRDRIVAILNDQKESEATLPLEYRDGKIWYGPHSILLMRGWGYLTGVWGLYLDPETAAIQDDMAAYIVSRLNNTNP